VLVAPGTNEIRWFTFAGNIVNLAIADTIRQHGYDDVRVSDYWICVKECADHMRLFEKIDGFSAEAVRTAFRVPEEYLKQLKFGECLPQDCAAFATDIDGTFGVQFVSIISSSVSNCTFNDEIYGIWDQSSSGGNSYNNNTFIGTFTPLIITGVGRPTSRNTLTLDRCQSSPPPSN
jgi:hypothetical protein